MTNRIQLIRAAIVSAAGGEQNLQSELPFLFRQAIDELIDAPRTRRLKLDDLEANEKAVLGIKVEAALRHLLDFPRGKLDFIIDGYDVDVKFTMRSGWMIPPEAIGEVCLLCQVDEAKAVFSIGLIEAHPSNLTIKPNRDQKLQISKSGKTNIEWLAHREPFPANVWENLNAEQAQTIFEPKGGTERIVQLFKTFEGEPIHRSTIHAVARQHDYMKRIRANQGARDILHPEGIVVLNGSQDGPLLRALNLKLGRDFVLPYRPQTIEEVGEIQKKSRHSKSFRFLPNP